MTVVAPKPWVVCAPVPQNSANLANVPSMARAEDGAALSVWRMAEPVKPIRSVPCPESLRSVFRSNSARRMARCVRCHVSSSISRASVSGTEVFHRRRHEPRISRGSGSTTSLLFCEKYVGEQNFTVTACTDGPVASWACGTLRCRASVTVQATCPSRSWLGASAVAGGSPAGSQAARHSQSWAESSGAGVAGHTENGLSCPK